MKPNIRLGIAAKILAGLAVIILVYASSAIVLLITFDRVSQTFESISERSLPLLVSTSLLVRESEKLVANAPDILIAENQFIRKALSDEITLTSDKWQSLVRELQTLSEAPLELSRLINQSGKLHANLGDLIDISNKRIEISTRTVRIIKRLRRIGANVNEYDPIPKGLALGQDTIYQKWVKSINQALITLLSTQAIDNQYDLDRLERSFMELMDQARQSLQVMPAALSKNLWPVQQEIIQHGNGQTGIFNLISQQLALMNNIDDTLFQNKFLSSKVVQSVNSIFSTIKNAISVNWYNLDGQLQKVSRLMIILPFIGIFSAVIIFTYLRRSVIGRVLALNEYMLAQIQGKEAAVPVGGDDEVGVMTASTNYFVTEINRREEKLRESEEKYRNLFNTAPVGIYRINVSGANVLAANDAIIEIFEYEDKEAFIREFSMNTAFPDLAMLKNFFDDLTSKGRAENHESVAVTKTGKVKFLALSGVIYPQKDYVECAVTDVTSQKEAEKALKEYQSDLERMVKERTAELAVRNENLKQEIFERILAEKALKESEGRFRILAENIKEVLILVDSTTGKIIYANSAYKSVFGKEIESLYNNIQSILDCIHPSDRERIVLLVKNAWERSLFDDMQIEYRIVIPGGEERWLISRAVGVKNDAGDLYRITIMTEDITNRRKIEQVLRESEERLRYLSNRLMDAQEDERRRLAAELHDDIGPSLASLKFGVERVIERLTPRKDHESVMTLKTVVNVVKTIASQVGRIQMQLRPPTLDDLGVIDTLDWFCKEYRSVYNHIDVIQNISVAEHEIPDKLKVVIFRIIQEALNNVARHSRANHASVGIKRTEDSIVLEIIDDGQGFDVKRKTRERRASGGLGLHSMQERAELSSGTFQIESEGGSGTVVRAQWNQTVTKTLSRA